jgi:hypothetical protein
MKNVQQDMFRLQTIFKSNEGRKVTIKDPTTTIPTFGDTVLKASATACVFVLVKGKLWIDMSDKVKNQDVNKPGFIQRSRI